MSSILLNSVENVLDLSAGKELLFRMRRIRHVEETIAARYSESKMRCPVHLCSGQEAVAAAAGLALRPDDFAVSGHRAHGHYLGKGGSLKAMLAEIYGKKTGCSEGKGGSMHLIDASVGFMGSTAIVGNTIPVGVGLGYSIKLKGTDQVSCIFLGDGAIESGVFYESVNFAALKRLPVLFVCENNFYSVYSPLSVRQPPGRVISRMVEQIGVPSHAGNGNDALGVFALVSSIVQSIRSGEGPCFLEFSTYRWREHCGPNYDNHIGYRDEEEFLVWREREPIAPLEQLLLAEKTITRSDIADMEAAIAAETEEAFRFAEDSPFPDEREAYTHLFAE